MVTLLVALEAESGAVKQVSVPVEDGLVPLDGVLQAAGPAVLLVASERLPPPEVIVQEVVTGELSLTTSRMPILVRSEVVPGTETAGSDVKVHGPAQLARG